MRTKDGICCDWCGEPIHPSFVSEWNGGLLGAVHFHRFQGATCYDEFVARMRKVLSLIPAEDADAPPV